MNMAFSKTIVPMREFRKTVTRRYGWHKAKPAQIVMAIEKGQGIAKGERVVPICEIQLLTPRWERADLMVTDLEYGERECVLEGFPELSPKEFVEMLCDFNKKRPDELVHRLEFRHLIRGNSIVLKNNLGETKKFSPRKFEYLPDGTLYGLFDDPSRTELFLDAFRFELS